jgi:hypothetical protein
VHWARPVAPSGCPFRKKIKMIKKLYYLVKGKVSTKEILDDGIGLKNS